MKVLITGANGFIGQALCKTLHFEGFDLCCAVRAKDYRFADHCQTINVGDIGADTDWSKALKGIDAVIHLAGHAHIPSGSQTDTLDIFRKVNVEGTARLAQMAAQAGVKRFIFISSVKVNGEGTDHPYTENDLPKPEDAYGISKYQAETALTKIAGDTGLKYTILRLPLVYGPGVKANFRALIKMTKTGLPLPFAGISNQRSLVYVGNVADAVKISLKHPAALNQTFLISDGQDLSTAQLIRIIAAGLNKKVLLFDVPPVLLKILFRLAGMEKSSQKLTGSLTVDINKIKKILDWKPPFSAQEGIFRTLHEGEK